MHRQKWGEKIGNGLPKSRGGASNDVCSFQDSAPLPMPVDAQVELN